MISSALKDGIRSAIIKVLEDNNEIENTISEYISANKDINSDELAQEIIGDFNVDTICESVERILLDRTLTFMVYPNIGDDEDGKGRRMAGEYACPSCYRPHGQWVGLNGVPSDPQVLKSGRTIIIAD